MYKDRPGHPAPAHRIEAVLHRDIVIHFNIVHLNSVLACHIRRIFKVHHISAVVFYNQKSAFSAFCLSDCLIYLYLGWRSKNIAADGCIQHALPHKASMGRFMAASTAAYQCHLILTQLFSRYKPVLF